MWLLFLACATEAPPVLPCEELEDPARLILEEWVGDRDAAIVRIQSCGDPNTQQVMVEAIAQAHPGQSMALCEVLPESPSQERCVQLNSRPHLWERSPPITVSTSRAAVGPGSIHPSPETRVTSIETLDLDPPCESEEARSSCLARSARIHAEQGRAGHALSVCRMETEEVWAHECLFEAAEARLESSEGDADQRYLEASALCLEAGKFRTFCLGHLHMQMARAAPPADVAEASAWKTPLDRADRIGRIWSLREEMEYGRLAQAHFWSETLWESVSRAHVVVGNPRDFIPGEAEAHLRAAVSYRLVADRTVEGQDLPQAVDSVVRVLSERSTGPVLMRAPTPVRVEQNLWPQDQGDDDQVPAVIYLGVSRRAFSEDPSVDIAICLLEAAARQVPRRQDLIDQGKLHSHPLVRWTAARLSPG